MEKMTQKKAMEITIAALENKEIVSDEIISSRIFLLRLTRRARV